MKDILYVLHTTSLVVTGILSNSKETCSEQRNGSHLNGFGFRFASVERGVFQYGVHLVNETVLLGVDFPLNIYQSKWVVYQSN